MPCAHGDNYIFPDENVKIFLWPIGQSIGSKNINKYNILCALFFVLISFSHRYQLMTLAHDAEVNPGLSFCT